MAKPTVKRKDDPNRVQFAISCKDYPAKKLTPEQGSLLKEAILKLLNKRKHSKRRDKYGSFTYDSAKGYLLVKCSKVKHRRLFSSVVPTMRPWPGACLKLITDKKFIRSEGNTYSCQFPSSCLSLTWKAICRILQQENEGLNTKNWKIIKKEKIERECMFVAFFTINESSMPTVESLGYELNYWSRKVKLKKFIIDGDCAALNHDEENDEDLSEDSAEDYEDDIMPEPGNSSGNSVNLSSNNWTPNDKWNDQGNFSDNILPNRSGNYVKEESFREESFKQHFSSNSRGNFSRQPDRNSSISQNRSSSSSNWNGNSNSCGGSSRFAGFDSNNSGNAGHLEIGRSNWSDGPSYGQAVNRSSRNWNGNGNWNSNRNFCDNWSVDFSQQLGRNNPQIQSRSRAGNWNGNSWDGSSRFATYDIGRSNSGDARSFFGGNGSFPNVGNSFNNATSEGNWSNRPTTSYGETTNPASRNRNQFYGGGNNREQSYDEFF